MLSMLLDPESSHYHGKKEKNTETSLQKSSPTFGDRQQIVQQLFRSVQR
jgi:hypothetical protein